MSFLTLCIQACTAQHAWRTWSGIDVDCHQHDSVEIMFEYKGGGNVNIIFN